MAVLAPVLERKVNTPENSNDESRNVCMTADERHNSRIKLNYARLINPDATVGDIIHTEPAPQPAESSATDTKPRFVTNARADSDIFRADSRINSKQAEEPVEQSDEEEENEDLRPTDATIKYKTKGENKIVVEDKINNRQEKAKRFSKREIIIASVTLLTIVALFVLVIVNSAVLSNLNTDISVLQSELAIAESNFEAAVQNNNAYFDEQNIYRIVSEFASKIGMVKIA